MANDNFQWHSLMGEYNLTDGEIVLLAATNGYLLVKYDLKRDVWHSLDGKQTFTGGLAMMPLPDVKHAFAAAWEQIKDQPYASLSNLKDFVK